MDSRAETPTGEKEVGRSVSPTPPGSLNKETIETKGSLYESPTDKEDGSIHEPTTAHGGGDQDGEYPDATRMAFIVIALLLSIFLVSLDMTIVATAIPKITDEFAGLDLVGWYGSAFFLTVGAFQSTWGKGYKYFPLKTTFLIAIFIFELGSLICGVAPNSTALIVGRAIAGLGGAGIASGAYTIIAFSARPDKRAAFTGLMGAAYGVASVIGPLLGGVFAEKATWRWCFYINLPIGGISAAIILFFFTTPAQAVPVKAPLKEKLLQMDIPGSFVIMGAIICYILALQWGGQTKPWGSSEVIGCLVGFVLILALWVVIEYYQGERAMIVGRLLKDRHIWSAMVFNFFLAGGFFLLLYNLPIYFQVVSGVSASDSGVRNLPLILGTTITTIISGGLISAFGVAVPFMIGGSALATIGAGLLYTLGTNSSSSEWIGYQALSGLGIGLALQVPIIIGQAVARPEDLSSVTAMILFAQTIGGAFFVSAGQVALSNVLQSSLLKYAPLTTPAEVLAVGVTEIRDHFAAGIVPGIVKSYMEGLQAAYAIAIASAGIAVLFSLCGKWTNLKGKVQAGGAA
ncbi:probable vacuolar basic amino acid transporter 3 [Rhynchosporium secalis]|uniref:Probable vacuolar basic amino acid transporter 3 n=1 Tax=Rhynchosporium secalis TaxID=38038 RepID=A0A1E1LWK4_RHYSE|nr:probable vacuolar basic amino acid transporter 3 [Rhynchosporium secalis]